MTVKRSIQSTHPSSLLSLRILAEIIQEDDNDMIIHMTPIPKNNNNNNESKLIIQGTTSVSNSFTQNVSSTTCEGLLGCSRMICGVVPECGLWGNERSSEVEGWIGCLVDGLVDVAYVLDDKRAKSPEFQAEVISLSQTIESHLFSSDQTYLVGEFATAADVMCAVLLVTAAHRSEVKTLPQQTLRLVETVLKHEMVEGVDGVSDLVLPGLGKESPVEKEVMKKKEESKESKESKEKASSVKSDTSTSGASDSLSDKTPFTDPENSILEKLSSLSLPHVTYSHPTCTTAEELVSNVKLPPNHTHTKNLFLRDKKHGLFLVTLRSDTAVSTKTLGKMLNLKGKVNLRLADEGILMDKLGVKKGCVGPLCIMNAEKAKEGEDEKGFVKLVLDEGLFRADMIHSHPLRNDVSTAMSVEHFKNFFEGVDVEPTLLNFDDVKDGEGAAAAAVAAGAAGDGGDKNKKGATKKDKDPKKASAAGQKEKNKDKKTTKKGETLLALQWKKSENFPMWYSDVIVLSEMISYYDISGCYILRPWAFKIWELVQDWFNLKIRELGVENSYFPMFVSKSRLEKEKDHVEGFSPEVAWVTKSGTGDLAQPIAVRPTSETVMYPAFSDWIHSHRDLPLKLNQWCNVVRWEFKDPTPFLRTREFLWQEGHTAHVSLEDADLMVMQALELYRGVYEDLLAVPVIKGYKTEKEKFAGGFRTTTVEAYIPMSGRAIQGATSHNLGQNFGKMFDIHFQNDKGESQVVWQTSWGLTTRSLGVMIMVHGDDMGLVLPPNIAPLQVVIVPIISKTCGMDTLAPYCQDILKSLIDIGLRAKFDDRTMYNPGWKYNHWEQKGVPIRIEVGPRDVKNKQARMVIRHDSTKIDVPLSDDFPSTISSQLDSIQSNMFEKAKSTRDAHVVKVTRWEDFVPELEKHNLVLTPWCGGEFQDWEDWVKTKSREESLKARGEEGEEATAATSVAAKTLCIPFDQPELKEGTKCIASGLEAKCWCLWGRSY